MEIQIWSGRVRVQLSARYHLHTLTAALVLRASSDAIMPSFQDAAIRQIASMSSRRTHGSRC